MRLNNALLTFFLLLLAGALSACSGGSFAATSWPGLVVADGIAYVAYNQHVYAIDATTGNEKWRFPEEADNKITFYAEPALTPDSQLVVGGYNNVLYSLNPETGQLNWRFEGAKNRFIGGPLVTDKGIYAPSADLKVYALDFESNLLWEYATQGPLWAQPASDSHCECIYLTSMDHYLYALDPESGALRWKSEDLNGAIVGTPAISDAGVIYVGSFASEMLALNAQNGAILWQTPTVGWIWSGPALVADRLYFGDLNGYFYALNATDGEIIWQLTPEQLDGPISGTPLVNEDRIYITTQSGSVFAVDTQGEMQWSQTVIGKLYGPPVDGGDAILVAPAESDNLLVALTESGAQKWVFNPNPEK